MPFTPITCQVTVFLVAGRQGTGQMRAQALAVLGDADAGGGGFAHHQQP